MPTPRRLLADRGYDANWTCHGFIPLL